MYKANILDTIIHLGIDAYIERITAFLGRRTLEGKPVSDETTERLREIYNELIEMRFYENSRKEFDGETLRDFIERIESLG